MSILKPQITRISNANDPLIDPWIKKLSINDAPLRRQGIATSLNFFIQHFGGMNVDTAASYLRCMDLSKRVSVRRLRPGDIVVAYRFVIQPPGRFYTLKGYAPRELGVNLTGRVKRVFQVEASVPALESTTSSAIDNWTTPAPGQDVKLVFSAHTRNKEKLSENPDAKLENEVGVHCGGGGLQLLISENYASMLNCKNPN